MLIASATPKENLREGGINSRESQRETPNPRCTQFGNTARCHGNAALPQSQSPHAERQRETATTRGTHSVTEIRRGGKEGGRLGKVRRGEVYEEGRCGRASENPHAGV